MLRMNRFCCLPPPWKVVASWKRGVGRKLSFSDRRQLPMGVIKSKLCMCPILCTVGKVTPVPPLQPSGRPLPRVRPRQRTLYGHEGPWHHTGPRRAGAFVCVSIPVIFPSHIFIVFRMKWIICIFKLAQKKSFNVVFFTANAIFATYMLIRVTPKHLTENFSNTSGIPNAVRSKRNVLIFSSYGYPQPKEQNYIT